MSHLSPGIISAYNSLTDKHLAGYFSNIRIRRHLQRAELITRSGRIVPDKEYRHKQIQRTHQRHVRQCLAQAIFHQVLEMERVHHKEIKRRLEDFARRERVNKIKAECSKRYEEDITRILSPHPPAGARGFRKQHSGPEGEHSDSSESPGSSRPNTAPEKMQRPVRLKPIHSNSTTATVRYSSPRRRFETSKENDQLFNTTMESHRGLTRLEASHGISPYCLPVINDFVTPVPPATKRKERGSKVTASSTVRRRTFRPATTSFCGADEPPMLRSSVQQSRVSVNMMYLGKTVHLSHDLTDRRDEVRVFQQHCGGENLCVYKGMLHEGETFRFISRRHRGFPFSLTFYLNRLQVERVSSCCEFKHRKGTRLGSRHRHFGFSSVAGASPCYKCIIAMGLDKKSTPPPMWVKEDEEGDKSVFSPKDAHEKTGEYPASRTACETGRSRGMETEVIEETAAEEDQVRDDYEEDFDADNEGPEEDAEANEKKSPSPSRESQRQVKERDASETEDDERDEDIKSSSASSFSGSDQEESDAEAGKDSGADERAETPEEVDEEALKPDEMDEPNPEEAAPAEIESAVAKDSDIKNSAGDSTELDISDSSVPSENKDKKNDDALENQEVEKMVDKSKQEEQESAKSLQEKLAEAILKESHCSSEPELSDITTEEEEESAAKSPLQDNKDAVPETLPVETSDSKEREDETKQELHQNSDGTKDEMVKVDEEDGRAESVDNTAANNHTEDTMGGGQNPVCEEEMHDRTSEPREDAAHKSADTAEAEEENEEKTTVDADTQPDKQGEEATGCEEDESSVSEPDKKTDESAVSNNAEVEAMTASQTVEVRAEASEEPVALRCEEAPVTNTDERQQGDSEDREAASETGVTAENSSSSLEGSGDTTIEKAAETNEDKAKDEGNKDDAEEEEVSSGGAGKEKQERCDLGEEQPVGSEKINDKVEDKSEDGGKEEETQTNAGELADAGDSEERKVDDGDNESKSDSNNEEKANEQAEKSCSEEDKAAAGERADESETAEKDEDRECVKNENHMEETGENGAASDQTHESEKTRETNAAANEEKGDEVEKNQSESEAEPSEAAKNICNEESEEIKVTPDESRPEEEILEIAEEPEVKTDTVSKEDDVKIADENIKSENVGEREEAIIATIEETVNEKGEVEDVRKERETEKSVNGDDAGEISSRAENSVQDEGGAQTEAKGHVETAEHGEDKTKTKEPNENESKEVEEATVDSAVEQHEDVGVDQSPDTNVTKSEAKEEDDKKDESAEHKSESETSVTEVKEEFKSGGREDCEETKQDENGNISERDHENRGSSLIENGSVLHSDVADVKAASVGDRGPSSVPTDVPVGLDGAAAKLEESTTPAETAGYPQANENAAVVDLSTAADGENEDAEALSKASEEGASVLLKPQTQSSPITPNNKAENAEESVAGSQEPPEALAGQDNTDLVKNWVTMHQASKFFETFVEPLEDLRESNNAESAKLWRSESPLKMRKLVENTQQEQMEMDVNESRDETKEEADESKSKSDRSEDGKLNTVQVEEETEVKDFMPEAEGEQNDNKSVRGDDLRSGERKGSRGSLEGGKGKEKSMRGDPEQSDISKSEVESIAGSHHSVTSGAPQIVSEIRKEEKAIDKGPEISKRQTFEAMKEVLASSETEGHRKHSTSPEGLSGRDGKEQGDTEETRGKGREVTEITDFTDDGCHDEDPYHGETQPKSSDVSISGDGRETQMIQEVQRALSKDRLSILSAGETPFGRTSYPLLTAARRESATEAQ